MAFDPTPFEQALDRIRRMWTGIQVELQGNYKHTDLGFASSQKTAEGDTPFCHPGGFFPGGSNHRDLKRRAWWAGVEAEWDICDRELRSLPALSWPELQWSLQFRAGNGLVPYQPSICASRISSRPVATSAHAGKRLSEVAERFPTWASDGFRVALDDITFEAPSLEDARELRRLLGGGDIPPRRVQHLARADRRAPA